MVGWIVKGILAFVILCIAVALSFPLTHLLHVRRSRENDQWLATKTAATTAADLEALAHRQNRKRLTSQRHTIREQENWRPQQFFRDPTIILACEHITAGDQSKLQQSIAGRLDVNSTGKGGFTLLHWAWSTNNLPAFQMLLKAGADPDRRLTQRIELSTTDDAFYYYDSILFTTLRSWKPDRLKFFSAALEHTKDINQRDYGEQNLLNVGMGIPIRLGSMELQQMLDKGIELDALDHFQSPPVLRMLWQDRADLCLQLLKSEASPHHRTPRGESLRDLANRKMEVLKTTAPRSKALADLKLLLQWLDEHHPVVESAK